MDPSDGDPAAAAAPAALALTMTADVVATLALALATVEAGPLTEALLPRTRDPLLNAAAGLFDLLLASALRTLGLTLCQLCSGRRGAAASGLAASAAAHAVICSWLAVKAGLLLHLTGARGLGGLLEVGPRVSLRIPFLLATEAAGLLFSG